VKYKMHGVKKMKYKMHGVKRMHGLTIS
jgi:hypothetical protein